MIGYHVGEEEEEEEEDVEEEEVSGILGGFCSRKGTARIRLHVCNECGKGFDSASAVNGHTRVHSKRPRVSIEDPAMARIPKKRSAKRNSSSEENPNFSSLSHQSEVEDAARCLILLSRDTAIWNEAGAFDVLGTGKFDPPIVNVDDEKFLKSDIVPISCEFKDSKNVKMGSCNFSESEVGVCIEPEIQFVCKKTGVSSDSEMNPVPDSRFMKKSSLPEMIASELECGLNFKKMESLEVLEFSKFLKSYINPISYYQFKESDDVKMDSCHYSDSEFELCNEPEIPFVCRKTGISGDSVMNPIVILEPFCDDFF